MPLTIKLGDDAAVEFLLGQIREVVGSALLATLNEHAEFLAEQFCGTDSRCRLAFFPRTHRSSVGRPGLRCVGYLRAGCRIWHRGVETSKGWATSRAPGAPGGGQVAITARLHPDYPIGLLTDAEGQVDRTGERG
jgi:hypothetical protein